LVSGFVHIFNAGTQIPGITSRTSSQSNLSRHSLLRISLDILKVSAYIPCIKNIEISEVLVFMHYQSFP